MPSSAVQRYVLREAKRIQNDLRAMVEDMKKNTTPVPRTDRALLKRFARICASSASVRRRLR